MTRISVEARELAARPNLYRGKIVTLPSTEYVTIDIDDAYGRAYQSDEEIAEGKFEDAWESERQVHLDLVAFTRDGLEVGVHSFAVDTDTRLVLE